MQERAQPYDHPNGLPDPKGSLSSAAGASNGFPASAVGASANGCMRAEKKEKVPWCNITQKKRKRNCTSARDIQVDLYHTHREAQHKGVRNGCARIATDVAHTRMRAGGRVGGSCDDELMLRVEEDAGESTIGTHVGVF